jgi:hypothetical protein
VEDVEQIWVRGALEKTIRDRGELYEKGPIIPWSETQAGFGLRPKADHKENKRSKNGVYAEKGYISSTAWVVLRRNLRRLTRRAVPASIRDADRPGCPSL